MHVGVGCVKLSVGPCHEADEGLGNFCLQLQKKAISGHSCIEVFDYHKVNKGIEIILMRTVFKIGCVEPIIMNSWLKLKRTNLGGTAATDMIFMSLLMLVTVGGAFFGGVFPGVRGAGAPTSFVFAILLSSKTISSRSVSLSSSSLTSLSK